MCSNKTLFAKSGRGKLIRPADYGLLLSALTYSRCPARAWRVNLLKTVETSACPDLGFNSVYIGPSPVCLPQGQLNKTLPAS